MPEMHLRQPELTYGTSRSFTKTKRKYEKGDSRYSMSSKWSAYMELKDISRTTVFDKLLCDKTFNVAKNPNLRVINVDLL